MTDGSQSRPLTRVLHRQIHHAYPVAVAGEGVHVIDRTGKRYIDASGGAAVSCLGHGHPAVGAAMKAQIDKLAFAYGQFFTTDAAEQLADTLIADAPAGLSHVYYVSGGSEGVEAALKMARQYFVEKGELQRRHIIARWQSYHGNTLGALSVGGNRWRRGAEHEARHGGARLRQVPGQHDHGAHEGDDAFVDRRQVSRVLNAARRGDLALPETAVAEAQVEECVRQALAELAPGVGIDQ